MVTPLRKCPACNADLEIGSVECAYCGSQVVQVALSFREREEVNRLAKRLNAQLSSEQTHHQKLMDNFLVTAWVSGAALILTLWLLMGWSDIWVGLLLFPAAFFFFREILKRSYLQKRHLLFFMNDIEPQIRQFLQNNNVPRWQFDQMADFTLPEEAPLRRFLTGKTKSQK
jgi:hypothetical protein